MNLLYYPTSDCTGHVGFYPCFKKNCKYTNKIIYIKFINVIHTY